LHLKIISDQCENT